MVSSSNDSKTDGKVIAVFSWGFNEAMKLEDLMRPTGCCTIFWGVLQISATEGVKGEDEFYCFGAKIFWENITNFEV